MPDLPVAPAQTPIRTSWFSKFAESGIAALAVVNTIFMGGALSGLNFSILFLAQIAIAPIFGIVFSAFWHSGEKRNTIKNTLRIHAWFQAMIRYWLAFAISIYGFGKILRTQFAPNFSRNDVPVGRLSGFELTWHYFGYSYALAVIIASLQISGSILLLFRRTTLAGVAILLPVMVNIVLINFFYHIDPGAFLNAILFTLALLYLLSRHRAGLVKLFLNPNNPLPPIDAGWLKYAVRLLAIGGAFLILFNAIRKLPSSPLEGKWTVDFLVRNRDTVAANAWLNNSGAWRSLYFERFNQLYLCPNPYIYEQDRSLYATYSYDAARHRIQLFFTGANYTEHDTATETVSGYDGNHMYWNGILGGDSVKLKLSRAQN
jgi:hypothetical protein